MDIRVLLLLTAEAGAAFLLLRKNGLIKTKADTVFSVLLILAAFSVRTALLNYETTDYQWFLTKWVDYYRSRSGFSALKDSVGNYNIPYLYFLALFSYSSVKDLYLIKLLSIFFDVILAYACAKAVCCCGCSHRRGLVCFFAVLFMPTAILNGALWGQCDSIYAAFAILGLAIGMEDGRPEAKTVRSVLSMACIAVSFGFKLQAVFIMPAYVILWCWKKYNWTIFAVFPLTYLLLILPAVILGRPFSDAILLYADQANTVGTAMNYNSPSMTAFMRGIENTQTLSTLCIILAFLAMLLILGAGVLLRNRLNPQSMLGLTLLMTILIPFFLPHMHDRYFFAADCLTIVFACTPGKRKDRIYKSISAVLMQLGSLICYLAYLRSYYLRVGSFYLTNDKGALAVLLCALITVGYTFYSLSAEDGSQRKKPVKR